MKKIIFIAAITLLLIGSRVFSQNDTSFWNNKMAGIAMPNSSPGWVRLKEGVQFVPENFFLQNKDAFGLKQNDDMILVKTKSDELGHAHYKFQHYYKGVKNGFFSATYTNIISWKFFSL